MLNGRQSRCARARGKMGESWGAGLSAGSRLGRWPGLRVSENAQVQAPEVLVRDRSTRRGGCC